MMEINFKDFDKRYVNINELNNAYMAALMEMSAGKDLTLVLALQALLLDVEMKLHAEEKAVLLDDESEED